MSPGKLPNKRRKVERCKPGADLDTHDRSAVRVVLMTFPLTVLDEETRMRLYGCLAENRWPTETDFAK